MASKNSTKISIFPGSWAILICSVVLFLGTVFVSRWTSNGPTFFSPEQLSPPVSYSLPSAKPSNSSDSGFLPLAKSPNLSQSPSFLSPQQLEPSQSRSPASLQRSSVYDNRSIPEFLQPPAQPWDLLFPTIVVAYICVLLPFIPSTNWTRLIVKTVLLILVARYFVWRTLATLNLSHWANATFSLLIYSVEAIGTFSFFINILQSVWSTAHQRSAEADRYSQDILSGRYLPSVDVFVPTYNEPEFVVRRTVVGCQAMEYPNKKVYILDDTRRPHIRALAQELGCEYITRPDNKHAKAGNLNNALLQTQGELITIMDADFVPFKNFLTRTVGFFQQPNVALVQTPQTFYNPDHHARNLGIDHLVYDDLANFFGFSQSTRDLTNSALCCGTSYVVRRSALEAVGGYETTCVNEDSPTSTRMLTRGFRIIYLKEILSMGESTRTYVDFIKQRIRWHQGNYQIFCCGDKLPIWSTMGLAQKSFFLTLYIGCFQPVFRTVFMLMPLVSLCLGISPIISTPPELIYYFVPWMLLLIGSTGWASEYCGSFFWNEVYEAILWFPTLKCLLLAIRDPFGLPFKVTPKGVKAQSKSYNFNHTWPLLVGIALMVTVLCLHLVGYRVGIWQTAASPEFGMIFLLLVYNIIVQSIAVLAAIDQPERRAMDRFPLRTPCKLTIGDSPNDAGLVASTYQGYTNNLCENGANITLMTDDFMVGNQPIFLEFIEYGFSVEAQVCRWMQGNNTQVALKFPKVTTQQNRQLIEMLYTDMTWWKQSKRPGSLVVFLAMLSSLLRLRPLLSKYD